jgi:hypothetical protein
LLPQHTPQVALAIAAYGLAVLLLGTIALERLHPMFRPQPDYYAALRILLSIVASLSLLVLASML